MGMINSLKDLVNGLNGTTVSRIMNNRRIRRDKAQERAHSIAGHAANKRHAHRKAVRRQKARARRRSA